MKVMILCGGQGTRIRDVAENLPKPLVDVGGRPILWHIMKLYAHYGFREFVLLLGYKGTAIKDFFPRNAGGTFPIELIEPPVQLVALSAGEGRGLLRG